MPVQRWSEQIWVVQAGVDPVFSEDIDYLNDRAAGGRQPPDMVIDLSGVSHLNSSNLSQLLRLRKQMIDTGARLRLAAPQDGVWAIFLSTALDKVFEFQTDTTTALADLQIREQ